MDFPTALLSLCLSSEADSKLRTAILAAPPIPGFDRFDIIPTLCMSPRQWAHKQAELIPEAARPAVAAAIVASLPGLRAHFSEWL